jgi:hypothetical protein
LADACFELYSSVVFCCVLQQKNLILIENLKLCHFTFYLFLLFLNLCICLCHLYIRLCLRTYDRRKSAVYVYFLNFLMQFALNLVLNNVTNVTKACYDFFATRNTTKNIIKFFSNRQRTRLALLKLIIIIILRLLLNFFFCYLTFEGVEKFCRPVLCFLLWCFHRPNKSKVLANVSNMRNITVIIFSIYLYGVELLLKLFLEKKIITCFLYYLFNDAVYRRCFRCVCSWHPNFSQTFHKFVTKRAPILLNS